MEIAGREFTRGCDIAVHSLALCRDGVGLAPLVPRLDAFPDGPGTRDYGSEEEDAVLRSTLDLLGVKRFTQQIAQHLRPILALARRRYET